MIHAFNYLPMDRVKAQLNKLFLEQLPVQVGEWQSQDVSDRPEMATREIRHVSIEYQIPRGKDVLAIETGANLPWAEDHFQERVSGEPLNPPPSEAWWPFAKKQNAEHKKGEIFSHTYPERMWPKFANMEGETDKGRKVFVPHVGIRFEYGDLEDVVQQLKKSPLTRQAYLPIWFPEDTGAVRGERVPCTLGYHFLIREGQLHITYYIRSCDFIRHFSDDVYMAARLAQWMVERFNEDAPKEQQIKVGTLAMHIVSFHIFEGDVNLIETRIREAAQAENQRLMGLL